MYGTQDETDSGMMTVDMSWKLASQEVTGQTVAGIQHDMQQQLLGAEMALDQTNAALDHEANHLTEREERAMAARYEEDSNVSGEASNATMAATSGVDLTAALGDSTGGAMAASAAEAVLDGFTSQHEKDKKMARALGIDFEDDEEETDGKGKKGKKRKLGYTPMPTASFKGHQSGRDKKPEANKEPTKPSAELKKPKKRSAFFDVKKPTAGQERDKLNAQLQKNLAAAQQREMESALAKQALTNKANSQQQMAQQRIKHLQHQNPFLMNGPSMPGMGSASHKKDEDKV